MTDLDTAALRTLAATLTVPTIADAPAATRVACTYAGAEFAWVSLTDWWSPEGAAEDDASNAELEEYGAYVTHVPVPVETVTAAREALTAAANELYRILAALAVQEEEFFARSMHPQGLDEGVRQGMGRVITAIRSAATGVTEGSDG